MTTPTTTRPDCRCGRPHSEHFGHELAPQCIAAGSTCLQYRPAADSMRTCTGCGKTKPASDFYVRGSDGQVLPKCKDCDNARPRNRTISRAIRVRARHKATAELIRRHDAEFRQLLDDYAIEAAEEAERLAKIAAEREAETTGQHKHVAPPAAVPGAGRTPRQPAPVPLRPGPRREGQTVEDRIDVARCPECVGYHDRGHRCESCGTEPQAKAG